MTDKCPPHQRFTTNWLAASARMLRIGLSDVGGDVFAILDLSGAGYDAKKDAGIFLTCAEKSTNSQLNLPHGNKKHEIEDVCLPPPSRTLVASVLPRGASLRILPTGQTNSVHRERVCLSLYRHGQPNNQP